MRIFTFREFFIKFIKLNNEIVKFNYEMFKIIKIKFTFRFLNKLSSLLHFKHDNIKKIRDFFFYYDDFIRIINLREELKKFNKLKIFFVTFNRKFTFYVISARHIIIITIIIKIFIS